MPYMYAAFLTASAFVAAMTLLGAYLHHEMQKMAANWELPR